MSRGERRRRDREAGKQACKYPHLHLSKNRCCICGGVTSTCPCTAQDWVNHYMRSHIEDNCSQVGHPSLAQMMMLGVPAPTEPCRNCGEVPRIIDDWDDSWDDDD